MESVSQLAKKAIGLQPIERIRLIEAILYSLDKSDPAFSNIRANLRSSVSTFNLQQTTHNLRILELYFPLLGKLLHISSAF